jgi:hypothetical protein
LINEEPYDKDLDIDSDVKNRKWLIWTSSHLILQAYLRRIQYSGALQPTEALLASLHRAQIYAIPFENIDIILGRGINLDPAALFDKLVHKQRGGYCFESLKTKNILKKCRRESHILMS